MTIYGIVISLASQIPGFRHARYKRCQGCLREVGNIQVSHAGLTVYTGLSVSLRPITAERIIEALHHCRSIILYTTMSKWNSKFRLCKVLARR